MKSTQRSLLTPTFEAARVTSCPGDRAVIWRYMDVAGFISILEHQELFFCPSDKLGDPLEGSLTPMQAGIRCYRKALPMDRLHESDPNMKAGRKYYFVSCWHLSRSESQAMWQLYSHLYKGIAIKSTVGRFKRSLYGFQGKVFIGRVDYSESVAPYDVMLPRLFLKRREFAFEREFRALITNPHIGGDAGMGISVDPQELILSLHLSPYCEEWIGNLVKRLMNRYKYRFTISGGPRDIVF